MNKDYENEITKRWEFPSDHLPLATSFFINNENFQILTLNCLNKFFFSNINKNH
jgi:hypothetical protein